uniref:ATP receptor n=1 Tax=Plectus sambesii TaxID=2011161 RepID=A0A914UL03_9BILA
MDQVTLPVFAKIRSYPLSIVFYFIRLCIFIYVILYGILWSKRYQDVDIGYGTVLTKVIGTVDTRNRTDLEPAVVYQRLWESTDLVESFQENGVLFITTNAIITPQQQQGDCAEDPYISEARCTLVDATNCIQGSILNQGNGKMTGKCVPTQFANSTSTYTCEVSGWCPTERMVIRENALFPDVKDFFILIKAFVRFPLFDKNLQNMLRDLDDTELFRDCQERNKRDNLADYDCPVFSLSYILKESGMLEDFDNIIAVEGGVLGVTVKWDCNFDYWENNTCQPKYIFRQLDMTDSKPTASWDFRDGITYRENGILTRDLHTVFGIFLIFNTEAMAGKLNFIDTLLQLSAAFNLFQIVPLVLIAFITTAALFRRKKERTALVDSDILPGTSPDTESGSAVSAIEPKQPKAQQNSYELQHSDDSFPAKSDASDSLDASYHQNIVAVIVIDISCGLLIQYIISLAVLIAKSCIFLYSKWKSGGQKSDVVKDFVEHMHDLKKCVILLQEEEPAMYVDKQRGAEPDGAEKNSCNPIETNNGEETLVVSNDQQQCLSITRL